MAQLKAQEDLKGWIVGCDKDIGGFSEAKLEITKNGTGKGYIQNEDPTIALAHQI
jgi:NADH dehydrogenase [ubiquinone] 1 alpha subcomplex assembly factor 1